MPSMCSCRDGRNEFSVFAPREANQHYERAQELLRQGDWNGYGEEIKKLGEVLKRMPTPK
jgi:hypothetical protein